MRAIHALSCSVARSNADTVRGFLREACHQMTSSSSARSRAGSQDIYGAGLAELDDHVGQLLAKLDDTGLAENTIVIFMSDHGEMLGDHGIYLKGPYFYEPAVHVPLIVSWPGRIAARQALLGQGDRAVPRATVEYE